MLEARLLTDNPLTDNSPYWAKHLDRQLLRQLLKKPLEQVNATGKHDDHDMMMHDDIPKING